MNHDGSYTLFINGAIADSPHGPATFFVKYTSSSNDMQYLIERDGQSVRFHEWIGNPICSVYSSNNAYVVNTFGKIRERITWNGSNQTKAEWFWNGVPEGSDATTTTKTTNNTASTYIGGWTTFEFAAINLRELILYNVALSDADCARIEAYMT